MLIWIRAFTLVTNEKEILLMKNMFRYRNMSDDVERVNDLFANNNRVVVFDTETTGLEKDANIIQFSAVLCELDRETEELKEVEALDVYINPETELDPKITKITGITDEMLKDALTEKEVSGLIMDFMAKGDIWAGYNVGFDIEKLKGMCSRTDEGYYEKPVVDVLTMARNMIPSDMVKNHKLATVTTYLLPDYKATYHNSLEDTRATAVVCENLLKMYRRVTIQPTGSEKLEVEGASYWQNPKQFTQQRIVVWNNHKNTGIYWDVNGKYWSCKSDIKSKKLFQSVDLNDVERQVLQKYSWKFDGVENMDSLGYEMRREKWNREKEEKELEEYVEI